MFEFGKKKEKKEICCCDGTCTPPVVESSKEVKSDGDIKVLGGGCAKCHELATNTKAALSELGINENVELITDFSIIAAYGVMSTPALVIDDKVVAYGKVLKKQEVVEAIKKVRGYV